MNDISYYEIHSPYNFKEVCRFIFCIIINFIRGLYFYETLQNSWESTRLRENNLHGYTTFRIFIFIFKFRLSEVAYTADIKLFHRILYKLRRLSVV